MDNQALTLLELNGLVRDVVEMNFTASYALVAEVSECRVAANGHCYLTFIEKGADDRVVAKASAHIWRGLADRLMMRFRRATGQTFGAGIKVLVKVKPELHELYGYALNVLDVDPSYTIGAQAVQREATIAQLKADGIYDDNRMLPLPRPLSRIAVISSETAAGYGDFCRQIEQSGYTFQLTLFPAIVQGDQAAASVCEAMMRILENKDAFDVVVIIRGGGAVSDLVCFDNHDLAACICQYPLPVLTGIGHERDQSVADMVANRAFKTPTAVAAFLVDTRAEEYQLLVDLALRVHRASAGLMAEHRERLMRAGHRLHSGVVQFASKGREKLFHLSARMNLAARRRVSEDGTRLLRLHDSLQAGIAHRLREERSRQELLRRHVELASPERILKLGFSITRVNGRVVRDVRNLSPGDLMETRLMSGTVRSEVRQVNPEDAEVET